MIPNGSKKRQTTRVPGVVRIHIKLYSFLYFQTKTWIFPVSRKWSLINSLSSTTVSCSPLITNDKFEAPLKPYLITLFIKKSLIIILYHFWKTTTKEVYIHIKKKKKESYNPIKNILMSFHVQELTWGLMHLWSVCVWIFKQGHCCVEDHSPASLYTVIAFKKNTNSNQLLLAFFLKIILLYFCQEIINHS